MLAIIGVDSLSAEVQLKIGLDVHDVFLRWSNVYQEFVLYGLSS